MKHLHGILDVCLKAGVAPLLIGETGVGKSAGVESWVKKVNAERAEKDRFVFRPLALGQMSPGDVQGVGFLEKSTLMKDQEFTRFAPCKAFESDKPICLFLDEVNRAHPSVIQAIFELVLNHKITSSEYTLPEGSFIILAGNPTSSRDSNYYLSSVLDDAFLGRVAVVPVESDFGAFKKYVEEVHGEEYARRLSLISVLFDGLEMVKSTSVDTGGDTIGGYTISSSNRKLDMAFKVIRTFRDTIEQMYTMKGSDIAAAIRKVLVGLVGSAKAEALMQNISCDYVTFSEFADVSNFQARFKFWNHMRNGTSLERKNQIFAILHSIVSEFRENADKWMNIKSSDTAMINRRNLLIWLFTEVPGFKEIKIRAVAEDAITEYCLIDTLQLMQKAGKLFDTKNSNPEALKPQELESLEKFEKSFKVIETMYNLTPEKINKLNNLKEKKAIENEFDLALEGLSEEEKEIIKADL